MIFYFSATGNSKYVAKQIAEQLGDKVCSIIEYAKDHDKVYQLADHECFGIVTPTYAWKLPSVVTDFLNQITMKTSQDNYIFSVATYGTTPGASGACVKHMLKKKGIRMDALYSIIMPDTWTPIFDLSNTAKVEQRNKRAEEQISIVIDKIAKRQKGNYMQRSMPYVFGKLSDKTYQNMRKTSHFHVEYSCIGCGLCEKKCPVNAIKMKDGNPHWEIERCVMCLGCLHRCPKFAIQYRDKTKKHGQYQNPNVTI